MGNRVTTKSSDSLQKPGKEQQEPSIPRTKEVPERRSAGEFRTIKRLQGLLVEQQRQQEEQRRREREEHQRKVDEEVITIKQLQEQLAEQLRRREDEQRREREEHQRKVGEVIQTMEIHRKQFQDQLKQLAKQEHSKIEIGEGQKRDETRQETNEAVRMMGERQEQQLSAIREQERQLKEEKRNAIKAIETRKNTEKQGKSERYTRAKKRRLQQERKDIMNQIKELELLWHSIFGMASNAGLNKNSRAEQVRIMRRHLKQSLEDMHERETRRQRKAVAQALGPNFPRVCRSHNAQHNCDEPNCEELHICRRFLADICNDGMDCRIGHSLTTVHNQAVCVQFNLSTTPELILLQQLSCALEESGEMTESMFRNNLEMCSTDPCEWGDCSKIHICRQFVVGVCELTNCKSGHDFHTVHNDEVLRRHRLTKMTDIEVINILLEKEHVGNSMASEDATVTSTAENGAIPRIRCSGNNAKPILKPSQSDGLNLRSSRPDLKPSHSDSPGQLPRSRNVLCDDLRCPICLETFRRASTLGCGHTFCAECLHAARVNSGDQCPLCRADISSTIRSVTLDNIISTVMS